MKTVNQYTLEGKFLREWPSGEAAARALGLTSGCAISCCCLGKTKSAAGHTWRFKTSTPQIQQLSCSGDLIRIWESAHEASKHTGVPVKSINSCCGGYQHTAGGFIWAHDKIGMTPEERKVPYTRPVLQYSQNGELIKAWPSIRSVQRELGIHPTCIRRCCNGEQDSAVGFIWKYKD